MAEKIFISGMRFERPSPKAPEWIKGKISIKVDELIPFLTHHKNEKGWVSIDLKKSKDNNLYLELNTFQPTKQEVTEEININDIPL